MTSLAMPIGLCHHVMPKSWGGGGTASRGSSNSGRKKDTTNEAAKTMMKNKSTVVGYMTPVEGTNEQVSNRVCVTYKVMSIVPESSYGQDYT
jgi:hypothetical protein